MNYLETQDWTFPVPIAYGPGRLREIAGFCQSAGMLRPLVVTDRSSVGLPFQSTLKACLEDAGFAYSIYSDISPNPRDDEILAGREHYRANHHDGCAGQGARAMGRPVPAGLLPAEIVESLGVRESLGQAVLGDPVAKTSR